MDWIRPAQNNVQWWDFVSTAMDLLIPEREALPSERVHGVGCVISFSN
jgi:hypothetical protein